MSGQGMENREIVSNVEVPSGVENPTTADNINLEVPSNVENPITADDINMEDMEDMEDIVNTCTQSSDTYNVQPARNRNLKVLALHILKHLPDDILREEPDFSSIKSNEAIPNYGSCQECEISILTEDPPRSLVLNVCGDVIHRTCANKVDNRGALPCSCGVADDSDPLLPLQIIDDGDGNNTQDEGSQRDQVVPSTSLNESRKRPNVGNTSSRKKAKTKKGESSMVKKLIEELKTLPSSVEDNSESQPEVLLIYMKQLSRLKEKL